MASNRQPNDATAAVTQDLSKGPRPSYLPDSVFGAIDGTVTTFAVVSGAIGADLPTRVVLILGLANLLADGFSMGAGNFVATRAGRDLTAQRRAQQERDIALDPEAGKSAVREIYRAKGYAGDALESLTQLLTSRHAAWTETVLAHKYGLADAARSPAWAALATFLAFVVAGSVPLMPFLVDAPHAAIVAALTTALVFFLIGSLKSHWSSRGWLTSGLETLAIGMGAAIVAYGVGHILKALI